MEPIVTLYEREPVSSETLPPTLTTLYGGGLHIPEQTEHERPYVVANFVESIDGVVSYNALGQTGGGVISGDNKQDQMVMGLLRASADAVIFGSSSLREDAGHVRIPSFIAPQFTEDYAYLRQQLNKREQYPISVIMTASGNVDLNEPTFHTPGLQAVIATTQHGYDILKGQAIPSSTEVRVIESQDNEHSIPPESVLQMLAHNYNVRIVLYEGGPTLLASFLAARCVDELFVTFAPQIAGRSKQTQHLSLVEGHAFSSQDAPWATLVSVKRANNHLLLRYKFANVGA